MGKIGELLAAIGRALRSGVRLAGEMSAATLEGIASMVAGMLRRRRNETEEHVDVADRAGEIVASKVADRVDEIAKADAAKKSVAEIRGSVGERMQLACRLVDRGEEIGRPFKGLADENALVVYLAGLTDENRAAILEHHHSQITRLLTDDRYSLRGVPAFRPRSRREKAPSTTIDEAMRNRVVKIA